MQKFLRGGAVLVAILGAACIFTSSPAAVSSLQADNPKEEVTDANILFAKHCATCHGKDGKAKTFKARFDHARNLTDPKWQAEVTDERLFNSISNGRGHMPAWSKKLSEAEMNGLVAYVRTLKK